MDLPVRLIESPPDEPVVVVDGLLDVPGLQLSHWPGNATPPALRHDLSTGAALAFAALPEDDRRQLAAGARAIVNNHYDTDGTCALFAVRHPEVALAHADALLAAASAGDMFRWPDDDALALDAIVAGMVDPARSPLAARFEGLGDLERRQLATDHLLEVLPALLGGEREAYRGLWAPVLEAARADRADLEACARDELVHLDWTVWTAPAGLRSSRAGAPARFDPGRHALFGTSEVDRALAIGPAEDGTSYRLLVNTVSWFDLVTRSAPPRPDLGRLAARLNELEGSGPADAAAWRSQDTRSPSPELWFGAADHGLFQEHAGEALAASRLEPALVRREVAEALRVALLVELEG